MPGCRDLTGQLALPETLQLIEGAAVLLANDTGLAHYAALTGTPTVVIFGPGDRAKWVPPFMPPRYRWFAGNAPCSPCYLKQCTSQECFAGIEPAAVAHAVLAAVAPERLPPRPRLPP